MKLIIAREKYKLKKEDLERLEKYSPIIYDKEIEFEQIKELYDDEEKILAITPGSIKDAWESITKERLEKVKNLKALCLSTTAFDWVPADYLKEKGIILTNTPGKSTESVAEFAIFMAIGLLRKLPLIIKNDWKDVRQLGENFSNKKVGIIGLGNIGRKIADLSQAYGNEIRFWNRSVKKTSYQQVELDELLKTSDILFLCVAINVQTKNLLSKNKIDLIKANCSIVTITERSILDEEYLLQKIKEGKIGGFAFEGEEKIEDYEGNIFVLPEIAYYTKQTIENESRIMTDSIISIMVGKDVENSI